MIYLDGISQLALRTADVERSVQFYLNSLGIDLTERDQDGSAYLRRGPKHHCITLYPLEYELPNDSETTGRLGFDHVGFEVSDRSAVDDAARTLEDAGARILRGPGVLNEPGSPYAVWFCDHDGNPSEICAGMEDWPEPEIAQAAKPLRLGHVNFHVRDPKESVGFYTEVLGIQALDWIRDFFVFLKCPGDLDHHHSALVKNPEVAPSLNHAAFEVRDFEALKTVADVMWKKDVRILWGAESSRSWAQSVCLFPGSGWKRHRGLH